MTYHVELRQLGAAISMSTLTQGATAQYVVRHDDGAIAWRGAQTWAYVLQGRSGNGHRLQASKAAKRLQAHLDRTGRRWELEQAQAIDAKQRESLERRARRNGENVHSEGAFDLLRQLVAGGGRAAIEAAGAALLARVDDAAAAEVAETLQRRAASAAIDKARGKS